jgi:putative transposase
MELIRDHGPKLGVAALCDALGVARASYYRWLRPTLGPHKPRSSPRALPAAERQKILETLHEPRFVDKAPAEIYATLLDDGVHLCAERTMYRILHAEKEVRERRRLAMRPTYSRPELLATKPNELWSWDITKLKGPNPWSYYQLYVIVDVFSRYVVGWMVTTSESGELAREFIEETCKRQNISQKQLTLHADRGTSMTSKTVALLLSDLGVNKTHSRPHVSNDNPYSEAQFKTLKYRPDFPSRFGSLEDAREHLVRFFQWYNEEHHHGGLGLLTPSDVHHGRGEARRAKRNEVLAAAYQSHPERFVRGLPRAPALPQAAWINKPPSGKTSEPGALVAPEVRGSGGGAPTPTA